MASLGAHVVMLPFGQMGHINPLLQLAGILITRGAQVTVVLSQEMVAKGSSSPPTSPNLSFVILPGTLPPRPSTGFMFRDNVESMQDMETPFSDLLPRLQPQASALVYDAFVTWAPRVACASSIPSICFFTVSATAGALKYHLPSLETTGVLPFRPDGGEHLPLPKHKIKGLEGLPELLPEDFPISFTFGPSDFSYRFLINMAKKTRDACAIIINSMEELEPDAIAVWKTRKPVFVIGPLLLLSNCQSRLSINSWPEENHCLSWLDSQTPSSVLYISFGSIVSLSLRQFQELALGLDASKQPFLWVVRPDAVEVPLETALPDGFRERAKDRGMIIGWGPQLAILSHPALGGFLTHGGWNSIVENISLGCVPMISWPHIAEQHLNRCMVVEHWKIGIRLRHNEDGSVSSEDIAHAIHDLFHGKQALDLRNAAKKVSEMAKMAVAEGGSLQKSFEALCSFLSNNQVD